MLADPGRTKCRSVQQMGYNVSVASSGLPYTKMGSFYGERSTEANN
jgi:hypothetical protein